MKVSAKTAAVLVGAALVLGSVVSALAQDATPAQDGTPQPAQPAEGRMGPHGFGKHGLGGPGGFGRPGGRRDMIRAEAQFQTDEGVRTVRHNAGTLQSASGDAVELEQSDGRTATVPLTADTTIVRDGQRVEASALQAGDHVRTMQERVGDADFTTTRVHAISAERLAQMQERREACEADPTQCPRGPGRRGRGRGPGPAAADPAAPSPEASTEGGGQIIAA